MQQPNQQNPFFIEEESTLNIKQEILRYLRYWPWFLASLLFCIGISYIYLRYAPKVYQTTAKIKILDEGKGLELPTSSFIFNRSNINLENEIEILASYGILEQVVKELNLTSVVYRVGNVQTAQIDALPYQYEQTTASDSIERSLLFKIEVTTKGFLVSDELSNIETIIPGYDSNLVTHKLPFQIKIENTEKVDLLIGEKHVLKIISEKIAVQILKFDLQVSAIGKQSDLLQLSMKNESAPRSEKILNTTVQVFNNDGISDRQLVSKRTLDFIDDRFVFLAQELDSIEVDKKDFKQDNNLVYLETDTAMSIGQQQQSEEEVFRIENQLALAKLIEDAIQSSSSTNELLPANVGIENSNVNALIQDYNVAVLDKDKLISSGGINNPTVKLLNAKLNDLKLNIDRSLMSYNEQLSLSQKQLRARNLQFRSKVSRLPQKEKLLRSIERQQKIKESLYLLLLQKREEAAINLAITEPSVKVVENALSSSLPVSPKPRMAYLVALLGGLLIPFGFLYILFMFDTKLHGKKDIEDKVSDIPVAGEIPKINKSNAIIFSNPNDRSELAESFRILSSNVNYMLPKSEQGKVIYCTSTIKGEGKTFISLNLSLALSSLNKKVLLIGADLRNPQLHTYIKVDKNLEGLSNYLHDTDFDWKQHLLKSFEKHPNHDTLVSGSLPPNPAHLFTNGNFDALLEEAKTLYDYIIVDTAPTILVTDTLLISHLADATLYITRADFTEKNLLDYSIELNKAKKLINMAYVVNGVGSNKSYGYNYGYGYGYKQEA